VRGLLIYGANGYTGELVAREALRRGLAPVLAGRRAEALEPLGRELGLAVRAAPLDDRAALAAALAGIDVVLHAAGPFVRTSRPMVDACLAAGAHYLDLTGEIAVFEAVYRRDPEAKRAGIALVPGVGFDVVPSDALATALHAALPGADRLELAFTGALGATWSRGTLLTALEGLPAAGWERRDRRLVPVRAFASTRVVEFPGLGRRTVVQIPWGDLSTAWRSTGIPNLATFAGVTPRARRALPLLRLLLPLLGLGPVKRGVQAWVRRRVTGPSPEVRARARMHLWGRASAADGRAVERSLSVPEGYAFTAAAAAEAARRALAGELRPGAWTPTQAFGPALLDSLSGVSWSAG
jgi:saccharopine dehydrogenase (NAD+, L-lysine-forming)